MRVQLEMATDTGAQVVDAQVDGAQARKAVQALLGRFVHVLGAERGHHGQATHGVQPGTDGAAVDAVVGKVADELGAHGDAAGGAVGTQLGHLEAQHLVENDFFLEQLGQGGNEFGLERRRMGGAWWGHEGSRKEAKRPRWAWSGRGKSYFYSNLIRQDKR